MFIATVTTLLLLVGGGIAFADTPGTSGFNGHMWGNDYGSGFGFFGMGMMVVVWIVLIALAVLAIRWLTESRGDGAMGGGSGRDGAAALDILKQRLAKGEIEPEEFAVRRKALET